MKLVAALFTCLLPFGLQASTWDFTFTGFQETTGYKAQGSGVLTFASGLTDVNLSDVRSFTFTDNVDFSGYYPEDPAEHSIAQYGLSDLTAFSMQLINGNPVSVSLDTDSPDTDFKSEFHLDPGYNTGVTDGNFTGLTGIAIAGEVTFVDPPDAVTPEPSSAALLLLAAALTIPTALRKIKSGSVS